MWSTASPARCATEVEREHLFLLALGARPRCVTRLPRLSARDSTRTRLAAVQPGLCEDRHLGCDRLESRRRGVLTDYGALPPEQRNILRLMFLGQRVSRRTA